MPIRTLAEIEKEAILAALRASGNVLDAAAALGMGKTTLYRKLKEWGINANGDEFKVPAARYLLLPRTRAEELQAELVCPKCHSAVLLPNGAEK